MYLLSCFKNESSKGSGEAAQMQLVVAMALDYM